MKKKFPGFTLLEVLIAVFILELGLLGIAGFYASSFKIIKTARNETIAANLASGVLDEQLAVSYDNIHSIERAPYSSSGLFSNWDKKVDITYVDENLAEQPGDTGMKKILVTVYWQEVTGEKSFQTATIKAKH